MKNTAAADQQPLVSVIVLSYNSSDTIIETLDSVYGQTYPNIELIISDDCSSDKTVALAQQWAQEHAHRFVNCVVHANPQNQGVPGNLNAGIRLSRGYYIKDFAADDLMLPECIELNVACCQKNGYNNLSSRAHLFRIQDGKKVACEDLLLDMAFFEKDAAGQYRDMLIEHRIISPTFFATRALLDEMGLYDTRYRFMEDYPMNMKIPRCGHKLNFLDAYTVEYRQSESSLSNMTTGRAVHPGFHKTMKKFFYAERFFELLKYRKFKRALSQVRSFLCSDLILLFGNDRKLGVVRFLLKLRDSHISPK